MPVAVANRCDTLASDTSAQRLVIRRCRHRGGFVDAHWLHSALHVKVTLDGDALTAGNKVEVLLVPHACEITCSYRLTIQERQ